MAEAGHPRLLQLPRGADEQSRPGRLPRRDRQRLAVGADPTQPKRLKEMGADESAGGRLASKTENPPSLAKSAVRRQYLREEPYAGKPHVRICAGGAQQWASLPRRSDTRGATSTSPGYRCAHPGYETA